MKKYTMLLCKSELERMLKTLELTNKNVFYTHCEKIKGADQMDPDTVSLEIFEGNGLSRDQWLEELK